MDYDKVCKDIIDLDPKIRFAGICDDTGEILYGGMGKDNKSSVPDEQENQFS